MNFKNSFFVFFKKYFFASKKIKIEEFNYIKSNYFGRNEDVVVFFENMSNYKGKKNNFSIFGYKFFYFFFLFFVNFFFFFFQLFFFLVHFLGWLFSLLFLLPLRIVKNGVKNFCVFVFEGFFKSVRFLVIQFSLRKILFFSLVLCFFFLISYPTNQTISLEWYFLKKIPIFHKWFLESVQEKLIFYYTWTVEGKLKIFGFGCEKELGELRPFFKWEVQYQMPIFYYNWTIYNNGDYISDIYDLTKKGLKGPEYFFQFRDYAAIEFLKLEKKVSFSRTSPFAMRYNQMPFPGMGNFSYPWFGKSPGRKLIIKHWIDWAVNMDSLDYWVLRKGYGKGWLPYEEIIEILLNNDSGFNKAFRFLKQVQFWTNYFIFECLPADAILVFFKYKLIFYMLNVSEWLAFDFYFFQVVSFRLPEFLIELVFNLSDRFLLDIVVCCKIFVSSFFNMIFDEVSGIIFRYSHYFEWQTKTVDAYFPLKNQGEMQRFVDSLEESKKSKESFVADLLVQKGLNALNTDISAFTKKKRFFLGQSPNFEAYSKGLDEMSRYAFDYVLDSSVNLTGHNRHRNFLKVRFPLPFFKSDVFSNYYAYTPRTRRCWVSGDRPRHYKLLYVFMKTFYFNVLFTKFFNVHNELFLSKLKDFSLFLNSRTFFPGQDDWLDFLFENIQKQGFKPQRRLSYFFKLYQSLSEYNGVFFPDRSFLNGYTWYDFHFSTGDRSSRFKDPFNWLRFYDHEQYSYNWWMKKGTHLIKRLRRELGTVDYSHVSMYSNYPHGLSFYSPTYWFSYKKSMKFYIVHYPVIRLLVKLFSNFVAVFLLFKYYIFIEPTKGLIIYLVTILFFFFCKSFYLELRFFSSLWLRYKLKTFFQEHDYRKVSVGLFFKFLFLCVFFFNYIVFLFFVRWFRTTINLIFFIFCSFLERIFFLVSLVLNRYFLRDFISSVFRVVLLILKRTFVKNISGFKSIFLVFFRNIFRIRTWILLFFFLIGFFLKLSCIIFFFFFKLFFCIFVLYLYLLIFSFVVSYVADSEVFDRIYFLNSSELEMWSIRKSQIYGSLDRFFRNQYDFSVQDTVLGTFFMIGIVFFFIMCASFFSKKFVDECLRSPYLQSQVFQDRVGFYQYEFEHYALLGEREFFFSNEDDDDISLYNRAVYTGDSVDLGSLKQLIASNTEVALKQDLVFGEEDFRLDEQDVSVLDSLSANTSKEIDVVQQMNSLRFYISLFFFKEGCYSSGIFYKSSFLFNFLKNLFLLRRMLFLVKSTLFFSKKQENFFFKYYRKRKKECIKNLRKVFFLKKIPVSISAFLVSLKRREHMKQELLCRTLLLLLSLRESRVLFDSFLFKEKRYDEKSIFLRFPFDTFTFGDDITFGEGDWSWLSFEPKKVVFRDPRVFKFNKKILTYLFFLNYKKRIKLKQRKQRELVIDSENKQKQLFQKIKQNPRNVLIRRFSRYKLPLVLLDYLDYIFDANLEFDEFFYEKDWELDFYDDEFSLLLYFFETFIEDYEEFCYFLDKELLEMEFFNFEKFAYSLSPIDQGYFKDFKKELEVPVEESTYKYKLPSELKLFRNYSDDLLREYFVRVLDQQSYRRLPFFYDKDFLIDRLRKRMEYLLLQHENLVIPFVNLNFIKKFRKNKRKVVLLLLLRMVFFLCRQASFKDVSPVFYLNFLYYIFDKSLKEKRLERGVVGFSFNKSLIERVFFLKNFFKIFLEYNILRKKDEVSGEKGRFFSIKKRNVEGRNLGKIFCLGSGSLVINDYQKFLLRQLKVSEKKRFLKFLRFFFLLYGEYFSRNGKFQGLNLYWKSNRFPLKLLLRSLRKQAKIFLRRGFGIRRSKKIFNIKTSFLDLRARQFLLRRVRYLLKISKEKNKVLNKEYFLGVLKRSALRLFKNIKLDLEGRDFFRKKKMWRKEMQQKRIVQIEQILLRLRKILFLLRRELKREEKRLLKDAQRLRLKYVFYKEKLKILKNFLKFNKRKLRMELKFDRFFSELPRKSSWDWRKRGLFLDSTERWRHWISFSKKGKRFFKLLKKIFGKRTFYEFLTSRRYKQYNFFLPIDNNMDNLPIYTNFLSTTSKWMSIAARWKYPKTQYSVRLSRFFGIYNKQLLERKPFFGEDFMTLWGRYSTRAAWAYGFFFQHDEELEFDPYAYVDDEDEVPLDLFLSPFHEDNLYLHDEIDVDEAFYTIYNDEHDFLETFLERDFFLCSLNLRSGSQVFSPFEYISFIKSFDYDDEAFDKRLLWVSEVFVDRFLFDVVGDDTLFEFDLFVLANIRNVSFSYKFTDEDILRSRSDFLKVFYVDFLNNMPKFCMRRLNRYFWFRVSYPFLSQFSENSMFPGYRWSRYAFVYELFSGFQWSLGKNYSLRVDDRDIFNNLFLRNFVLIFYNPYNSVFLKEILSLIKVHTVFFVASEAFMNRYKRDFFQNVDLYVKLLDLQNYPQLTLEEAERVWAFLGCTRAEWDSCDSQEVKSLLPYNNWDFPLVLYFVLLLSFRRSGDLLWSIYTHDYRSYYYRALETYLGKTSSYYTIARGKKFHRGLTYESPVDLDFWDFGVFYYNVLRPIARFVLNVFYDFIYYLRFVFESRFTFFDTPESLVLKDFLTVWFLEFHATTATKFLFSLVSFVFISIKVFFDLLGDFDFFFLIWVPFFGLLILDVVWFVKLFFFFFFSALKFFVIFVFNLFVYFIFFDVNIVLPLVFSLKFIFYDLVFFFLSYLSIFLELEEVFFYNWWEWMLIKEDFFIYFYFLFFFLFFQIFVLLKIFFYYCLFFF